MAADAEGEGGNLEQLDLIPLPPVTSQKCAGSASTFPAPDWEPASVVVSRYVDDVRSGRIPASRCIRLAADRFVRDLDRSDLLLDWEEVERVRLHCYRCGLVEEWTGSPFCLLPWQLWVVACLYGWRRAADGARRTKFAVLMIARGAGKTTFLAALALWDLVSGPGRRAHAIANKIEQAAKVLDCARTMAARLAEWHPDLEVLYRSVRRAGADALLNSLTSAEKSLDGLNPSLWIGDEAAEWRGRFVSKLETTAVKRRDSLGVLISTPGDNPDLVFAERVELGRRVLAGEVDLDADQYFLFELDPDDDLSDESAWPKANPGMPEQPRVEELRASFSKLSLSPIGRAEWARYHCCRAVVGRCRWLDMSLWLDEESPPQLEDFRGRPAWLGLDLSKSGAMTSAVVVVPLDDGTFRLFGRYWWPMDSARDREVEYALPLARWAAEGRLTLTEGREVDLESVRAWLLEVASIVDLRQLAFDRWGIAYFRQQLVADGLPLVEHPMSISVVGPATQVFQQLYSAGRIRHGNDPILRRCFADAEALRDANGNIRPVAGRRGLIDGLMAALMALHACSLETAAPSVYESPGFVV